MTSEFKPLERLDGRTVLIAGALGAVGKATAARFANLGARIVALHRRTADEANAFLAQLPKGEHFAVEASITDSASLTRAASAVRERVGKLDVLVNTAGFTKPV